MKTALAFDYPTAPPARAGALCDLCGTDPHSEYTCLWRRYRTLLKVPAVSTISPMPSIQRSQTTPGRKSTVRSLLRRMLARAAAHKDAYGLTGSVQELEDDRNAKLHVMTRL